MIAAFWLPIWLTDEHYLTLATWGLVVVTLLLVIDSWGKGREQRRRWDREDATEAEAKQPRYEFGLRLVTPRVDSTYNTRRLPTVVKLWVASFGLHGLYIDRLFIKHRDFAEASIAVEQIVSAGNQLEFELPKSFWQGVPGITGSPDGVFLYGDHEIWLEMSDARHRFITPKILYTLEYSQSFTKLRRGGNEPRQATCPKCKLRLNLVIQPAGYLTEDLVQAKQWRHAMLELNNSCPNHASDYLHEIPD